MTSGPVIGQSLPIGSLGYAVQLNETLSTGLTLGRHSHLLRVELEGPISGLAFCWL